MENLMRELCKELLRKEPQMSEQDENQQ